mmetsp:Transcript_81612/g.205359  ORF Transcript_81612/g.205359 Transcript_81612/m.205359 type:complete len:224 (-) Transcript_81612:80-751(-)
MESPTSRPSMVVYPPMTMTKASPPKTMATVIAVSPVSTPRRSPIGSQYGSPYRSMNTFNPPVRTSGDHIIKPPPAERRLLPVSVSDPALLSRGPKRRRPTAAAAASAAEGRNFCKDSAEICSRAGFNIGALPGVWVGATMGGLLGSLGGGTRAAGSLADEALVGSAPPSQPWGSCIAEGVHAGACFGGAVTGVVLGVPLAVIGGLAGGVVGLCADIAVFPLRA